MAIRFQELYEKTKDTFQLELLAGKKGMDHVVGWVHLLEDEMIINRFAGQELAVTTGMKARGNDWLLSVVRDMKKADCSGIIVNTGMYLQKIPEHVIAWCEEQDFPLLVMPWEISCTIMTQQLCMQIMNRAQKELEFGSLFQSILRGGELTESLQASLRSRFDLNGPFQIFCMRVGFGLDDTTPFHHAILRLENTFGLWRNRKKLNVPYLITELEDCYLIIINNLPKAYHEEITHLILDQFSHFLQRNQMSVGIGPVVDNIRSLNYTARGSQMAAKMAFQTRKESVDFDEMGFFKVLFAAEDTSILKAYEQQLLGALDEYDRIHHSDYVGTLRSYIENDRSLMGVAETTFTHRNTVNYRIQNIKKLLNCELKTVQDLFPYQVAFYIRDMHL